MFSRNNWEIVKTSLDNAAKDKVFPGAVFAASKLGVGEVILSAGNVSHEKNELLREDAVFDVASLTKAVCTTSVFMQLFEENKISLTDPMSKFFASGECQEPLLNACIKDLLSHQSGLRSYSPFFEDVIKETSLDIGSEKSKEYILNRVRNEELSYECRKGFEYSDLGFILLGEIAERLENKSFDRICEQRVFSKLNMKSSSFIPWKSKSANDIFPNRQIPPARFHKWLSGETCGFVDDENCYAMGGVAGHAGLFSTAADLLLFSKELMNAYNGDSDYIQKETAKIFFKRISEVKYSPWAAGWKTPSKDNKSMGSYFGKNTIGHLGFTGCSLWMDLDCSIAVLLLSNRVNPDSKNIKIREFRPIIHDMAMKILKGA